MHAEGGNGLAPGLSQRTIAELAEDYTEAAYRLNKEGSDIEFRPPSMPTFAAAWPRWCCLSSSRSSSSG